LLGCAGVTVLLVVAGVFAVRWGIRKIPEVARKTIDQVVSESDLSDEDKRTVMTQVDRVIRAYEEGRIDMRRVSRVMDEFAKSPWMDLMIAYAAKERLIDTSQLTAEEKAEFVRTLQRIARGINERSLSAGDLRQALNRVCRDSPDGGRTLREDLSTEELRAFLAECKRMVDEAGIPDEDYQVHVGEELKRMVDEALGEVANGPRAGAEEIRAEAEPPSEETGGVRAEAEP
jgi:hypothetical protein